MEAFAPTVPHFFTVMLDEDIKTGKLVIPKKFVRKYGTNLCKSNVVLLKVPTGDRWEVELRASDGVVRLEKGWPDFLNFYSIEHGDFLMFRYEPRSSNELDVVVCNKTCTEVEYPKKSRVNMSLIKVEDVIAEETRESQPSRRTARRKTRKHPSSETNVRSKDPSSSAKKARGTKLKRRSKGRGEGRSGLKVGTEDEEGEENGCIQICGGGSEEEEEGRKPAAVRGPARVGQPPSSSTKKRNPFFEKSLTSHDVNSFLTLPRAVATEAGQWTKESSVIRGPGGRKWPVAVKLRTTVSYRRVDLSTGWLDFIRGTGLSPGDIVRFEFLGGITNVIESRVLGRAPAKKI